jgi:acetyltransferase
VTPGNTAPPRFRAGDPIRAIAALGVVVTHVVAAVALLAPRAGAAPTQASVVSDPVSHLGNGLSALVYLFFVLSGYLVAGPFLGAFVTRSERPPTVAYLRNRALRILPLFWVAVVATLLVFGHRGVLGTEHHRDFSAFDVVAIFGFFQQLHFSPAALTFGQAWTLHVEVVFYLCLPLVAVCAAFAGGRLGRRARVAFVVTGLASVWVASAVVRAQSHGWTGWLAESSFVCSVWAFVPGAGIALLETTGLPDLVAAGRFRTLPFALGAVGIAAAIWIGIGADAPPAAQTSFGTTVLLSLAACALVAAPMTLQWCTATTWRVLDNAPLQWLGRRSYGIYLLHVLVILLVARVVGHATDVVALRLVLLLVASVGITVLLADLAWRFVEQPCLRYRSRRAGAVRGIASGPPDPVPSAVPS